MSPLAFQYRIWIYLRKSEISLPELQKESCLYKRDKFLGLRLQTGNKLILWPLFRRISRKISKKEILIGKEFEEAAKGFTEFVNAEDDDDNDDLAKINLSKRKLAVRFSAGLSAVDWSKYYSTIRDQKIVLRVGHLQILQLWKDV